MHALMSETLTESHVAMRAQGELLHLLGFAESATAKQANEALSRRYLALVVALAPTLSIEVGAHEGRFSRVVKRRLSARGKAVEAIAFEANPEVYARHRGRLASDGVDYRNTAVSNELGTVTLKVPTVGGASKSTMGSILDFGTAEDTQAFTIPSVRLDDVGSGAAVLWIDVEGAIREVLSGGEALLSTCLAAMIEVEEDARWPGQMLAAELLSVCEAHGLVAVLRDAQRHWQYNVLLVRRELRFDGRVAACRRDYFADLRALAGIGPKQPAAG